MPLYEYRCAECHTLFEKLRPMSQASLPIACSACGSSATCRALSLFSALSKSSGGASQRVSGTGGGCGSCGGGSCGTCNH